MVELKPGDVFLVKEEFELMITTGATGASVAFKKGQAFTVTDVQGSSIYTDIKVDTLLHVVEITVALSEDYIEEGKIELLRPVEEEQPPDPPEPGVPPTMTYRLTYVALKKGRNRPGTNTLQLAATKLGELKGKPEWGLTADGAFGNGTDSVVKSIQAHYGLTADGVVGKNTWHAMTPDLASWRAPMKFRIAECQCTYESGTKGYGYYGAIYVEGWFNYGIWNCNRWSAKRMLQLGGAPAHLTDTVDKADAAYREYKKEYEAAKKIEDEQEREAAEAEAMKSRDDAFKIAAPVAQWYGSNAGRTTQVGDYFLIETLKPSIRNLVRVGFDIVNFGINSLDDLQSPDDIPNNLEPFYERLLALSCDITINSGPNGFFPKKSPRAWQSEGATAWPANKLPFKEEAKQIYSEVFGAPIPDDYTYITSDTRQTYADALTRCLSELCHTDEQAIELIAELQSRCIVDLWRDMVIRRRRSVAWKEGFNFQGTYYNIGEHFGLGI